MPEENDKVYVRILHTDEYGHLKEDQYRVPFGLINALSDNSYNKKTWAYQGESKDKRIEVDDVLVREENGGISISIGYKG
jgi:hypothetical protein